MKKFVLPIILVLAFGFGQNLLTNGNFDQPLDVGWTRSTGGSGYVTIARDTFWPGTGYQAFDSLYSGPGWGKLGQTVDVPGITLMLSFWAKFDAYGTSTTCWPAGCINVGYYDDMSNLLGQTRFYYSNQYCTWTPTSTFSLINITNPDWNRYTLDIAQELSSKLPGINPGAVSKVEVALYDTTAGG